MIELPFTLVAELTYRCPLACAYCSNPVRWHEHGDALDTRAWARVFAQAEALGVVQVHLTGGEPLLRDDLEELVSAARARDLFVTLITSGIPLERARLRALRDRGLDALQLSLQGARGEDGIAIAGRDLHERKLAVASSVRELGIPLTLNVVLHRGNIDQIDAMVALAERLGASRLELANVQLLGWAHENRAALLPDAVAIERARAVALAARDRLVGRMEIIFVLPDHHAGRPRACMGGWARRYLIVTPDGLALPCQAAHPLPLEFWRVQDHTLADIWSSSPGLAAFRGEAWMRDPCRTCARRHEDHGGCRCQAFTLTGDAAATDPACALAPLHEVVLAARTLALADPPRMVKLRRR